MLMLTSMIHSRKVQKQLFLAMKLSLRCLPDKTVLLFFSAAASKRVLLDWPAALWEKTNPIASLILSAASHLSSHHNCAVPVLQLLVNSSQNYCLGPHAQPPAPHL